MGKRMSVVAGICLVLSMCLGGAAAAAFPEENIHWIVGFKPGGGFDIYSRAIAQSMEKFLPDGVHVVVENHPGSASQQAASMVYNADPDGYTIGIWPMPGLYVPQMFLDKKYDARKVTWLGTVLREPMCLAISKTATFRTLKDLQAADVVRITLTGFTGPEIAAPITLETLGIKAKYITGHKNSKESILAAMRGDGDAMILTYGTMRKHILKGDFIPVLLLGDKQRNPEIPEVPTATEAGYPQLDELVAAWRSIGGPPGIAPDRTQFLRDLLWKAMHDEEFVAWSKKSKRPVVALNAEQTEAGLKAVLTRYEDLRPLLKKYIQ
ncbi:MAG TPA: tripartite tricarboxylate transporter substrate-binding protein [Deferrisomatales bacterium]|nr:tripartite tricarboxylate transporter substrate-binding protein [Deferrisomatales bacterium]